MDTAIVCEEEYLLIVAQFDYLWGRATTPQEQVRMECMIGLINAFDAAHAVSGASMFSQRRASPAAHASPPMTLAETRQIACLYGRP